MAIFKTSFGENIVLEIRDNTMEEPILEGVFSVSAT